MISAKEARAIVEENKQKKLQSQPYKDILLFFEDKIRKACENGETIVSFMDDDIVDSSGKKIYTSSFYNGNSVIKNYMIDLGYGMNCGDHGHIEIYW